ncbi:four-helix bundle copper-binding protein [Bacillus aerolatus]|uniref:Four-helix bundle copper-binding protein n=1 Tax=Bacillus aerolatus TaxID=2653354 RepID=A0A6I1FU35_9BACI|nr:four-helix bundle copper-binding protein [Bacillus aerolatus]KAB7705988.1 four-helix bundle copper-binding protein [Bacillus aerolatus]
MNATYEECLQACLDCLEACNVRYNAYLNKDDLKMMASCIRLDRECADACALAVKALQFDSPFAAQICQLCADICEACGKEYEKYKYEHCQKRAEVCFKCAEACRKTTA